METCSYFTSLLKRSIGHIVICLNLQPSKYIRLILAIDTNTLRNIYPFEQNAIYSRLTLVVLRADSVRNIDTRLNVSVAGRDREEIRNVNSAISLRSSRVKPTLLARKEWVTWIRGAPSSVRLSTVHFASRGANRDSASPHPVLPELLELLS